MRLKAAQKVHYDSGPNMTPLVDIVMVILIFLMLTGSFAVAEHWLQSNMPLVKKGAGNTEVPKDYVPDTPLEIYVESTGENTWTAKVEGSQVYHKTKAELRRYLEEKRASLLAANQQPDKIQVFLRPTKTTKYKHLIAVYEAALDAQLKKVAFMMAEKD